MRSFHNVSDREQLEIFTGVYISTFWGNEMLLSMVNFSPNTLVPLHSHHNEQAGIVMSGEIEFTIGGETRLLKKGEIFIIPGGTEHNCKTGDTTAVVLEIFSPVREDYKY